MPKYIIRRASWKTPPCEDAVEHHSTFRTACRSRDHGMCNGTYYTVEAKDLEELVERFKPKALIVSKPTFDWAGDAPKIEVMIYDDWIE